MFAVEPNIVRVNGTTVYEWTCDFTTNNVSDPDPTATEAANIAVVTRTGVGTFRVRFVAGIMQNAVAIRGRMAHLRNATATPNRAQCGSQAFNTDGTTDFTVFVVDAAGAAVESTGMRVSLRVQTDERT